MIKQVCSRHFEDKTLHNYVTRHGELGECDYCNDGKERKVVDISDLGEFMQDCLFQVYDDAANWLPYDSREGGYQGVTYETRELIEEYLDGNIDENVFTDLNYEIDDVAWCDYDPYGERHDELLMQDWENFKTMIQHKQRFTIFQPKPIKPGRLKFSAADILTELGKMILRFQMTKTISAGTIVYRCRQHEKDNITKASEMCSPSNEHAVYPNRMSPAGVSMFYGSLNQNTSALETINKLLASKPYYSIAAFALKEDILVVDFSQLPKRPSIFNPHQFSKFHWVRFLENFVEDLSRKIKKDDKIEHVEYAPTQAVTEYIRFMLKTKGKDQITGMIYPSSKDASQNCLVLFYNHEESLEKLRFLPRRLLTTKI